MDSLAPKWIVLFGGAGREGCIERLVHDGIAVEALIVPRRRSVKFEASLAKLSGLGLNLIEVDRESVRVTLQHYAGVGLLSIGFPYLIAGDLLQMFRPALNVHPTLLPRYRGPTTAAYILINGEAESGSTVHHMTPFMDRGDVVAQSRVALSAFDTIRSLQRKVYASEPQLVVEALAAVAAGIKPCPQDELLATEYPQKRSPTDSELDPSRPLRELFDHIRACDPDDFPAFFMHQGQKVCVRLWRPEKPNDEFDEI